MTRSAVARNYAGALFELASRDDARERYDALMGEVAAAYRDVPAFRRFLDSPRVPLEAKKEAARRALGPEAPELLLRFLFVALEKRRHRVLPEIAAAYHDLLDEEAGRVHATVSLAFEPDEELRREIEDGLEAVLEKDVVPHFREDPGLLGGIRVRVGDRVMDGSLRRRLDDLGRSLIRAGGGGPWGKRGRIGVATTGAGGDT